MRVLNRLFRRTPTSEFSFGVQIENGRFPSSMQYVAPRSWIKRRVNWAEVDARGWTKEDQDLSLVGNHPLLLTVHNAPKDCAVNPDRLCGEMNAEAWWSYASFVITVIDRYNPKVVELWNEPDATLSPFPDLFGCWPEDGKSYSKMVEKVYKIVKRARPKVMILSGALSNVTGNFAKRLPKCDGVSFHSYPKARGGVAAFEQTKLKAELLRSLGHRNIWLTETSLLQAVAPDELQLQAAYFDYLFTIKGKINGAFWYTLSNNGWEHSDMIERNEKKPVWYRYQETLA